jgi:hypothetical protein
MRLWQERSGCTVMVTSQRPEQQRLFGGEGHDDSFRTRVMQHYITKTYACVDYLRDFKSNRN